MGSLTGKTALVTGASRGIGRAIAQRLAADGALVAVHYGTNHAAAQETTDHIITNGGRAFPLHAPLGASHSISGLYAELDTQLSQFGEPPTLHILVNNAGFHIPGTISDITPDDFDRLIDIHARTPLFLIQHALPRMPSGGRIINITSVTTRIAHPTALAYTMAKAALQSLTQALARDLGHRRITINNVAPGYTKTDLNRHRWDTPEEEAKTAGHSVFNRIADPSDIADVTAFLASHDSRWITGQTIDASGGTHL
ncbi:SDR family oxidoreductase [Streptomyces sp. B93]|uniref:SDR family oxidoreductase n=1 Tax=Streptomyces sp. B93 TaxID=2824875 RepID=UPI001B358BEF|nr:SDR family oxidoreductase [Streptomyces sp. B93]MBQ1093362.1 SDR family oxidoreductase [Streptomyces sp. B93]